MIEICIKLLRVNITSKCRIEQELMARILSEIAANRNLQLASEQERQRETHEKHVHTEPGEVSEESEESSSTQHDSLLGKDNLGANQLSKYCIFYI